jgi:hypothetical protein
MKIFVLSGMLMCCVYGDTVLKYEKYMCVCVCARVRACACGGVVKILMCCVYLQTLYMWMILLTYYFKVQVLSDITPRYWGYSLHWSEAL